MWEEARGLYPSHQIPELDQSHHAESLASKVSSKLQNPSSSAPTQGKALWAAADTPLESPGGHAVKWPCSTQRQRLPGLGCPGPALPPCPSHPRNDRINPKYIMFASLQTMVSSRKSVFSDCLHLGHLQMWDFRTPASVEVTLISLFLSPDLQGTQQNQPSTSRY